MTKKIDYNAKYEQLMEKYKELRMDPDKQKESLDILDEAVKLRKGGKVSDDSITAGAYL